MALGVLQEALWFARRLRGSASKKPCDTNSVRVLVADKFEQSGLDGLTAAGCEVSYQPAAKDAALANAVQEFQPEALVVRSAKVAEAALAAPSLKLVVRAGAGYNTIDVAAASRRGIYVSNCPGKNSVAVAELAFGLILALDRRIPTTSPRCGRASGIRASTRRRAAFLGAPWG